MTPTSVEAYTDAESQSVYAVYPSACARSVTKEYLGVLVEFSNSLEAAVQFAANLSFPDTFVRLLENKTSFSDSPYLEVGLKGATGNCSGIPSKGSAESLFVFPVSGSFPESEYYCLAVHWYEVTEDPRALPASGGYVMNVTPFEWFSLDAQQDDSGFLDGATYDLRTVDVTLDSQCIYKGNAVYLHVTVHNYGRCQAKAFLNAEIKEDSCFYIGFDRGVDAYYGNGVDMLYYVNPGSTYNYYFAFGPVLYDSSRGIWALNGRIDADTFTASSLWYVLSSITTKGSDGLAIRCTHTFYPSEEFYVIQATSSRRILAAAVDDETCLFTDPAAFYEQVVDYPIRIGEGNQLEPYTTFEQEFGLDIQFTTMGSYDWPDPLHGWAGSGEALRNTAYALGANLKLGGDWVSEPVQHPDNPLYYFTYTQRENHGFDIGVGLMPAGFIIHSGEGNSHWLGSIAVTMGTNPYIARVKECAMHEICHLFGALHGNDSSYGADKFGPNYDGFTYVMADGTGADFYPYVGWRMHWLTRDAMTVNNRMCRFDGAPAPELISAKWYGQTDCYVRMNGNQLAEHVHLLDSDGLYDWNYDSSEYTRFSVTDSYVANVEQSGRYLWTKCVDAEISYPSPGMASFYVAYKLYWLSSYWPTGFSPGAGLSLKVCYWIRQDSSTTASVVDNVAMKVISTRSSTPTLYYSAAFEAASPAPGWNPCHGQWSTQEISNVMLYDTTVYFLLGFRDAWSADYSQQVRVQPFFIHMAYSLRSW